MIKSGSRRAVADTVPAARRWKRVIKEVVLTVAAVIGVICMLTAIAAVAFGIKPLVFRSGSMSPGIETGALGLARTVPAVELTRGDVVSVKNAAGVRITHRIEAVDHVGDSAELTLKGDANDVVDSETYHVVEADRLFLSVNNLGYGIAWLSSTPAVFVGGAVVGGLLVYAFRPRGARPGSNEAGDAGRGSSTVMISMVLVLAGSCTLGLVTPRVLDTEAAWVDAGTATGGTFATLTIPSPTSFTCRTTSGATFSWDGLKTDRYQITLSPALGGSPVVKDVPAGETSYRHSALLGAGTATVRRFADYGSTRWYSQASTGRGYLVLAGVTVCA